MKGKLPTMYFIDHKQVSVPVRVLAWSRETGIATIRVTRGKAHWPMGHELDVPYRHLYVKAGRATKLGVQRWYGVGLESMGAYCQ